MRFTEKLEVESMTAWEEVAEGAEGGWISNWHLGYSRRRQRDGDLEKAVK